ncbi:MAG: hypothetical protein P4L33_00590 [Capsulimonadaceae bacterium]|nr:hypothetical protein [Capsulimonadaceae bacterium]
MQRSRRTSFLILAAVILMLVAIGAQPSHAGLWQYSAPLDSVVNSEIHAHARAYLWIPPKCRHVRAVVVAQHNLLEESILLNPKFRRTLESLDMAEVWVMPSIDFVFDFHKGAGDVFDSMMKTLASASGYSELAFAPARTLAILSVHGDMPQSNLTGSGRPNPDWGNSAIDGIPGLFVMGQYEWLDARTQPGLDYVVKHPATPLAMLPDIGHGHFDTSDEQVAFLCLFLRKAVQYRFPSNAPFDAPVALKAIDPRQGWLVDRWEPERGRKFAAAPYDTYTGDRNGAFWCFDREMAEATENYGKGRALDLARSIVYVQDGKVLGGVRGAAGVMPRPKLEMDADGRTLHFAAYEVSAAIPPGTEWNDATAAALHARQLVPKVLCGPIEEIDAATYRLEFDQSGFNSAYRSFNVFISTMIPDGEKSMVRSQPAGVFIPHNGAGMENAIAFPPLPNVSDRKQIRLSATASSGLPVAYYVDSGPATIDGDTLKFTPIPPRSKFPVEVRVVAWQWGRAGAPQVKSAEPVVQTFSITK